jgi:hypothetical protein
MSKPMVETRLREKGDKENAMPVHHLLGETLRGHIAVPQASKADNSYSKARIRWETAVTGRPEP